MKTRLFILLTILAFGLCTSALAQDWSTGSGLMSTGSSYSSTITPVGATGVVGRGRTATMGDVITGDSDEDDEPSSWDDPGDFTPIGDAWALLFFAVGAAGLVAVRRRSKNAAL